MAAIALTGCIKSAKSHVGSIGVLYTQAPKYSTDLDKNINTAAWKRGTGGRSSFNGIVATVFGCTGFLGRFLCGRLGRTGSQIILPYRCDHYDCMKLKVIGDLGQVLFQPFELRDQESIEKAVKYSNVVINLIGRDYETKNFTYEDVHIKGARAIAKACAKVGVDRLIHVSYLNAKENPQPMVLKHPSKYQTTKWAGEQAVREEFPDATIIKASDMYGTDDRFLLAYTTSLRRHGHCMPMWLKGEQTFKQPVYVADVAQGIINAAKDPETKGKTIQAVGPRRYQMGELVDWFHRVMRKDVDYYRYDLRYDPIFQMRVTMVDKFSPAYPLYNLHWEGIEKETTTDIVDPSLPTLEDLGVQLTNMEDQVPWELKIFRAHAYYLEEIGEFAKPAPPPIVPMI